MKLILDANDSDKIIVIHTDEQHTEDMGYPSSFYGVTLPDATRILRDNSAIALAPLADQPASVAATLTSYGFTDNAGEISWPASPQTAIPAPIETTPATLHDCAVSSSGAVPGVTFGSIRVPNLSTVNIVTNDPYGMVNPGDDTITIVQSGRYRLFGSMSSDSNDDDDNVLGIDVNGTQVASNSNSAPTDARVHSVIEWTQDLTAGDKVRFTRPSGTSTGFAGLSLIVQQLPTATITTSPSGPASVIQIKDPSDTVWNITVDTSGVLSTST